MEPSDQSIGAINRSVTPNLSKECPVPMISAGPTSRNTPLKPMSKPTIDSQVGLFPPERKDSNKTSQNGEVVMSKAAIPDGTLFSASPTNPLPPSNRNVPTMAVDFQLLSVGFVSPAVSRQIYKIAPEAKKRI